MSEVIMDKLSRMTNSLIDYPVYVIQWVGDGHIEDVWSKRETLIKMYESLGFRLAGVSGEKESNYLIPEGATEEEVSQGNYYKIVETRIDPAIRTG